jgi:hypothetical protein
MISYSTKQQAFADALHERLQRCGCAPKLDHLDLKSGERWRRTIAWWLSACETAVVLLSPDAIESPWLRYELSVLSNRQLVGKDVTLVLVYLGITRQAVQDDARFDPFSLGDIHAHHELPGDEPDEETIANLAGAILASERLGDAPIDRLVGRVFDQVGAVGRFRLRDARGRLRPAEDPWLTEQATADAEVARLGYSRALCATPLDKTFASLEVLARDEGITKNGIAEIIDLSVMTTFDTKTVGSLHRAACGPPARRSLVAAITSADMADVAARTVPEFHDTQHPARFVLNGPITGHTIEAVIAGLVNQLRKQIEDSGDTVETLLGYTARRNPPVYAVLTAATGITRDVLAELERLFPAIVFVVLASRQDPMCDLAERLGVEGAGPDLHEADWEEYVDHQHAIATERRYLREDLKRVKRMVRR